MYYEAEICSFLYSTKGFSLFGFGQQVDVNLFYDPIHQCTP